MGWKTIPRLVLNKAVRPLHWHLRYLTNQLVASTKALGVTQGIMLLLYSRVGRLPWNLFSVRIPGIQHPVLGRTGSSDPWVLSTIFVEREYDPLRNDEKVELVLDCGANVGYSSVYFLNRYPRCRVLAVEPDPENLEILRLNLKPYGERAEVIPAAVWSKRTSLVIVPQGTAWATQVRAVRAGEHGDLVAIDVPGLLQRADKPRVDVLKVDIEGSEAEVFSGDVDPWLPRVGNLVIELHGEKCTEVVERALSGYEFEKLTSGELTMFLKLKRLASSPAVG